MEHQGRGPALGLLEERSYGGRAEADARVVTDGKHLALAGRPYRVRGVTYGSFRDRGDGALYPDPERVADDFARIADAGLNTVRVYTAPPRDLLEAAEEAGLRLIVGVQYEDWRYETPGRGARARVRDAARRALDETLEACAGRSSVLAISVGNEVPPDVVRVYGIGAIEKVLSELVSDVHQADPEMLATYTNFPSTEYLRVEGQDFVSFNVFLESAEKLRGYLGRLQVVSGELPLVLTELGLAAGVHGEEQQADSLAWQLLTVDELGCAGACVFSWTDEWAVADVPVEGWGFGLTDEGRDAKPALDVVRSWASLRLVDLRSMWPRVSVVVCAHNEAATIEECLGSLAASDYPDLEVLLCDDGSTDGTPELAERFPCRIIRLEHGGLSAARNTGIEQATGEIVAFLDADATCHSEWPYHLALSLEGPNVVATGGPNLAVADAPFVERAVAASPGGPVEVLLSHDRAEHVPGCNMAYRKDALEEIGGFDPIYRAAGDDVDVCWKLLERGYEIAFAPAAQVRHHRRGTVRAYLRQQRSYGRAERLLAGRWRHRMNRLGQARWKGSLYGGPRILPSLLRPVVYHGWMGFAPFQGVTRDRHHAVLGWLSALSPAMLPLAALGLLAPVSLWFLAAPVIALAAVLAYGAAIAAAVEPARDEPRRRRFKALVGLLHVVQPVVRTWGRLRGTPAEPLADRRRAWMGDRAIWLAELRRVLGARHCRVRPAQPSQSWDLTISVGPLLACRVTTAVTWGWTPHCRLTWRPRWLAAPVLAAVAAAALGDLRVGAIALCGTSLVVAVETWALRRIVGESVLATVTGAQPIEDAVTSEASGAHAMGRT